MKKLIKSVVLGLLTWLARIRLRRLRLFIVGITGSIGKTSTKDAIYAVLKSKYKVSRSEKSYNTDFGLPLAILEQKSGFSSPFKWLRILFGAVWKAFVGGRHVQMLVIEMGLDKPGDMLKLLKLARPQIGVMTNIKPVHVDEGQFKDMDDIFLEKKKMIEAIPEKGIAVLNADDPYTASLRGKLKSKALFYGVSEWADLRAFNTEKLPYSISFSLQYGDEVYSGELPVLGSFQIYTVLPAVAVALTQGFTLEEAGEALKNYQIPPGRMNPIQGIEDSLIIDSSYNASPESVKEALNVLGEYEGRRIAVLGNMNELGAVSEEKHREVGAYAATKTDMLITVGDAARWLNKEAIKSGLSEKNAAHYKTAEEAAEFLKGEIKKGDTVLVKGSQNKVRLERLVKKIMKEPWRAVSLLVRQEEEWKNIP